MSYYAGDGAGHTSSNVIYSVSSKIQTIITKHCPMKRLSAAKRRNFSLDLAFIAIGTRTGYLVDSFSVPGPVEVFGSILSELRTWHEDFKDVAHIHEPASGQSFFVNIPMFRHKYMEYEENPTNVLQVVSTNTIELLTVHPDILHRCLQELHSTISSSKEQDGLPHPSIQLQLPQDILDHLESAMVPTTAFLLDYPVAYYSPPPSTSGSSIPTLGGVPLDIYECILTLETSRSTQTARKNAHGDNLKHCLLKFSCPTELGVRHPNVLGTDVIRSSLERLRNGKVEYDVPGEVVVSSAVLDRVAL